MTFSDWSSTDIPDELDADDVPGALATIFANIDPMLVLKAKDVTDRDTRYADLPKGCVVATEAESMLWIKTSSTVNTWGTSEYQRRVTTGYTDLDSRFTMDGFQLTQRGSTMYLQAKLQLKSTAADITAGAYNATQPGNLLDDVLFRLPAGWNPTGSSALLVACPCLFSYYTAFGYLNTSGNFTLASATPGAKLIAGSGGEGTLHVNATWNV